LRSLHDMFAGPFGEIVLADPERLRQLDPTILDNY
jgi:hypothetical protein